MKGSTGYLYSGSQKNYGNLVLSNCIIVNGNVIDISTNI